MAESQQTKYGVLAGVVTAAGCIMATSAAITLAFRGRANWEPSEQDIPAGPEKVAALVSGILIVIFWTTMSKPRHLTALIRLARNFAIGCVLSLLVYGFLVGTQTFTVESSPSSGTVISSKIIGGYWLINEASEARQRNKVTTQELLKGAGYDPDKLWSRPSRALAKLSFVVFYMGLVVCGTVGLSCAAIVLGIRIKNPTDIAEQSKIAADLQVGNEGQPHKQQRTEKPKV
jgi:hypothetical protein